MSFSFSSMPISAFTLTAGEQVIFNWKITKFLTRREIAEDLKNKTLAKLAYSPARIGKRLSLGTPNVAFTWNLMLTEKTVDEKTSQAIGLFLERGKNVLNDSTPDPWLNLHTTYSFDVIVNNKSTAFRSDFGIYRENSDNKEATKEKADVWGWDDIFLVSDLSKHLDSDGTLNIRLIVSISLETTGTANVPLDESDLEKATRLSLEEKAQSSVLDVIAALLGDAKTADLTLAVLPTAADSNANTSLGEVKKFDCHAAIFSARSPVFRAMFANKEMTETKDRVVKIEDVSSAGVVDQFLTFLYTGRFKGKRQESGDSDPTWVTMLPELVYLADKYDVNDLLDFCDVHLHRCLTTENAAELLKVAHQHGLKSAEAKLKHEFKKNIEMLIASINQ